MGYAVDNEVSVRLSVAALDCCQSTSGRPTPSGSSRPPTPTTDSSAISASATTPGRESQSTAPPPSSGSVGSSARSGSRRPRRANPLDVDQLSNVTGTTWGHLVRDHYAATPEDFFRLVVDPPQPLLPIVSSVAHARVPLRNRGRGNILEQLLDTGLGQEESQSSQATSAGSGGPGEEVEDPEADVPFGAPASGVSEGADGSQAGGGLRPDPGEGMPRLSRAGRRLLLLAWSVYRAFRLAACPYAPQPTVDDADTPLRFTRAAARYLHPQGIRPPVDLSQAAVRRTVANERLRGLWEDIRDSGAAVVWFDNFYRRRFMRTPARMDVSLNVAVVSVLVLPRSPDAAVGTPERTRLTAAALDRTGTPQEGAWSAGCGCFFFAHVRVVLSFAHARVLPDDVGIAVHGCQGERFVVSSVRAAVHGCGTSVFPQVERSSSVPVRQGS